MSATKVVLISKTEYTPSHDSLLESILDNGLVLFCVVGKDCEIWESAMDTLCELRGGAFLTIATTSHPGESIEGVLAFASIWPSSGEVECISV